MNKHQLIPIDANTLFWGVIIFVLIVLLVVFAIVVQFLRLYVFAAFSGAPITIIELVAMRLRKLDAAMIVRSHIQAVRAGLNVDLRNLEVASLAGANVQRVVAALIAAKKANIDLPWETAFARELAGHDVLKEISERIKNQTNQLTGKGYA